MKKIALVAALAALSASAFAQSSVTLYGRLNTTVESQKTGTDGRVVAVNNNASRLGVKGVEDIGGGLKASFNLEHGLNSDDGKQSAGAFWGREAFVQLAGEFGAVRLGSWTPGSYLATADYVSLHNHDTGTSADSLYGFKSYLQTNKVGYFTPTIEGFSAEFTVSAGEGATKRGFDFSANYDQGPLHLGAGYSKQGDHSQFAGRALYELGDGFTVGGYLERVTQKNNGALRDNRTVGRLAVQYTLDQSEFHLNVGGSQAGAENADGRKQWTLGYNYNLSKRTKVYGYYTAVDSKVNRNDFSSLAVGVRHNF